MAAVFASNFVSAVVAIAGYRMFRDFTQFQIVHDNSNALALVENRKWTLHWRADETSTFRRRLTEESIKHLKHVYKCEMNGKATDLSIKVDVKRYDYVVFSIIQTRGVLEDKYDI